MKQFVEGFFIPFYLEAIESIFVLFSIDVTELSGLSGNIKKNGTLPNKLCQKVIQG